jgi:ribonuclease P protein component
MPHIDASNSISVRHAHRNQDCRLHRHGDYKRVYASGRKQFSVLVNYFVAQRPLPVLQTPETRENSGGPRVGITAGRVLGNAVERNRIKRRVRASIRQALPMLTAQVDVVLHPKSAVLNAKFNAVAAEVERIFRKIQIEQDRTLQVPRPERDPAETAPSAGRSRRKRNG